MIALTCCTFALGKKPLYSSWGVMVSMTAEECPDWAFHCVADDENKFAEDVCETCGKYRYNR